MRMEINSVENVVKFEFSDVLFSILKGSSFSESKSLVVLKYL